MIFMKDVDGVRRVNIDGRNLHISDSVFITGERGYCIEVDRAAFIAAVCSEFGLARMPVAVAA
jgi:hypothetical protein